MLNAALTPQKAITSELPPQLLQVIAKALTAEGQQALRAVFERCSRAIHALADLDLSRFEADHEGEQPYEVWEQLAPVVGETMTVVHNLVQTIDKRLANDGGVNLGPAVQRAGVAIRPFQQKLREDLLAFRDGMQKPQNMANRWDLLSYLAAFRGRARADIGEMVHAACLCFGPAEKADVVPQYRQDMDNALALRRALAVFGRQVAIITSQMQRTNSDEEIIENGKLLHPRLEKFTKSPHYSLLRVADRQVFAHALSTLATPTSGEALRTITLELFSLLKDFSINRRELLVQHDREVVALALTGMARAKSAFDEGLRQARLSLNTAIQQLARLEGRSPAIDRVIDQYRGDDFRVYDGSRLSAIIGDLSEVLRRLSE